MRAHKGRDISISCYTVGMVPDDSPAGERLDLETRARLRAIAVDIFTRHGAVGSTLLPPEGEGPLELYGAYHNRVSLAGGKSSFFAPLFA